MSLLDFLADFAATGRVGGAGIYSTPEQWQQVLGEDFIDDRAKKRLRRDYGLVELGFARVDGGWRCGTVSMQVHRLSRDPKIGPVSVRAEYGDFPTSIAVDDLHAAVGRRGHPPTLIDDADRSEYTRYVVPASKVLILAVSWDRATEDGPPAGAIWSLALSDIVDAWIRPRK
jgi:hypothetical protein